MSDDDRVMANWIRDAYEVERTHFGEPLPLFIGGEPYDIDRLFDLLNTHGKDPEQDPSKPILEIIAPAKLPRKA